MPNTTTNSETKPERTRASRKIRNSKTPGGGLASSSAQVARPTAQAPAATPGAPVSASTADKAPSKLQQVAVLLLRDEGATLDQMVAATGWLPHTTRAALAGLKKKGYGISSDKIDGVRTYRAVAPE